MVRTVVADDERLARQKLLILLNSEPQVQVVAECQDGKQTVSAIRNFQPDLLLLDIQMPELDGFEVLGKISPHSRNRSNHIQLLLRWLSRTGWQRS